MLTVNGMFYNISFAWINCAIDRVQIPPFVCRFHWRRTDYALKKPHLPLIRYYRVDFSACHSFEKIKLSQSGTPVTSRMRELILSSTFLAVRSSHLRSVSPNNLPFFHRFAAKLGFFAETELTKYQLSVSRLIFWLHPLKADTAISYFLLAIVCHVFALSHYFVRVVYFFFAENGISCETEERVLWSRYVTQRPPRFLS